MLTNNADMLVPTDDIELGKHINDCFVENISKSLHNQHKSELLGANFVKCLQVICSLNGLPLPFAQCLVMDHCLVDLMRSNSNPISRIRISKTGKVEISCPAVEAGKMNFNSDRWIDVASFRQHNWARDLESCTVEEKTYRYPNCTCVIIVKF